jgi:hypothetical protein
MSRIYFHSEHGADDAELCGSERAYMSHVCSGLLLQSLNLHDEYVSDDEQHWLTAFFPTMHYARDQRGAFQLRNMRTAISVGFNLKLELPDGRRVSPFTLALNTALRVGSDPIKLMARLHGQCEVHAWVDGPNRAWLAGIIDQGRAMNLYRANAGWESVAAFLRERDDCPVVTSYSVCDGFPNSLMGIEGGWSPGEDDEDNSQWYDLSDAERWRFAFAGLRAKDKDYTYGLELRPDNWAAYYVGSGVSGYDLATLAITSRDSDNPQLSAHLNR